MLTKKDFLKRVLNRWPEKYHNTDYKLLPDTLELRHIYNFKCKIHGSYEQRLMYHIIKERHCPTCSEIKHRLIEAKKFKSKLIEKFGEDGGFNLDDYVTNKVNVKLTCSKHGDISGTPGNVLKRDSLCPYCDNRLVNKERFLELSKEAHGDKYDYSKVAYVNSTTKVTVLCPTHGEFRVVPHVHYSGRECIKCAMEKTRLTEKEFILRANKVHDNKYTYKDFIKSTANVTIVCPVHGEYTAKASSHLEGHGCSTCGVDSTRSNTEEFIAKAKGIHGDKFCYSDTKYYNSKTKVIVRCKVHGKFKIKPNCHLSGRQGCPKCIESKGESTIRAYIESKGLRYIKECTVDKFKYRWDFYVPKYDLFIEFHGQQHYGPVELFGGKVGFRIRQHNDNMKRTIVNKMSAYYLEIKYTNIKEINSIIEKKINSLKVCDITKREIVNNRKIVHKG